MQNFEILLTNIDEIVKSRIPPALTEGGKGEGDK
jgi:hypothetical protein